MPAALSRADAEHLRLFRHPDRLGDSAGVVDLDPREARALRTPSARSGRSSANMHEEASHTTTARTG